MWKKMSLVLLFCLMAFSLTGCEDVIELSEDETKVIAEYAADILLKHDLNYTDRIDEGNKALSDIEEIESTMEVRPEPISTEEVSTENEIPPTEEVVEDSTKEQGKDVSGVIENEEQTSSDDAVALQKDGNIAKIAGLSEVKISYKDYILTKQYPATDEDGKFIYLESSEGYQLLVVRFSVTSMVDDTVDISLLDKDIDYRIVCNGNKAANPMLTILMDDLGTLETTVLPGEEQEAVLIFQISDELKSQLESIDLHINYDGVDNRIQIL